MLVVEDSAVVVADGAVELSIDHCETASCVVVIENLNLHLANFDLRGQTISRVAIGRGFQPIIGTLSSGGVMNFAAQGASAFVRGRIGSQLVEFSLPVQSVIGIVDDATGSVRLRLSMSSADEEAAVVAELAGVFSNRPPRPKIALPATVECESFSGSNVPLALSDGSDPDGNADLTEVTWFVDGVQILADPSQPHASLQTAVVGLGSHRVTVRVRDAAHHSAESSVSLDVVDTTPPVLVDFAITGPVCLWPPNHDFGVLRVERDFGGVVFDACDPNARLEILGAASSEPDDSTGDGNTRNDVVVFPDRACLRTERKGNGPGRRYVLSVAAIDSSGNTSDPEVPVLVPHDQSVQCVSRGAETASANDVTCIPSMAMPDMLGTGVTNRAGGCSSVGDASLLFALALLRRKRQRA